MARVFDAQGRLIEETDARQPSVIRGAGSLGQLDPLPPCDLGKAQWIRLADVLLVGPLMIAGGLALRKEHPVSGYSLLALGVGTMGLNGYNYYRFAKDFGHVV